MSTKWIYPAALVITLFIGFYFYQKYKVAPAINLKLLEVINLEGQAIQLESFEGKKLIICFSASWCVNCLEELETISGIKEKELADMEVIVISDEPSEKIQRLKDKKTYPFTFLKMKSSFASIGINSIPTTYLVNKDFKVVKETVGDMHWEDASTLEHYKKLMD